MNVLLFDGPERIHLLPLTYIRPVAHIRIGIDRLQDKWEAALATSCSLYTQDYLQNKYPPLLQETNLYVNPAFVPNAALIDAIDSLTLGHVLVKGEEIIAGKTSEQSPPNDINAYAAVEFEAGHELIHLKTVTDLFINNATVLAQDFDRITTNRKSAPISASNKVISQENIFIEPGAVVECSILNALVQDLFILERMLKSWKEVCSVGALHCVKMQSLKWEQKFIVEQPLALTVKQVGSSIMF